MTRIVIAGAGIAGLSAALALSMAGVLVTVVERRSALEEAGAGIQLSPNAVLPLRRLGLLDALEKVATEPESIRIRRGVDGAELARLPLGAAARKRYGAPFLVVHRADLLGILVDAVGATPDIDLCLGAAATVEDNGRHLVATVTQGGVPGAPMTADGFVGAQGLHGWDARSALPVYSGKTAWRALVPAGIVSEVPRSPITTLWLGAHAHLVQYPLRRGATINVVAVLADPTGERGKRDPWSEPGDPDVLRAAVSGWHRDARALVDAAPAWKTWPLFDQRRRRVWSHGCCTAVGDAAHPMVPFLAQGASQAIEDAAALALAVRSRPADVPGAFSAYEQMRRSRVERVQAASRRQSRIYHLAGPAATARDLAMRLLGSERMLAGFDWLYGHDLGRDTL